MTETPEELLERLKHKFPKRAASLDVVHKVCEGQRLARSSDYSSELIGILSGQAGGPGKRAIRNPAGEPYRQLIAAYRAAYAPEQVKTARKVENAAVSGIKDPVARARVNDLSDQVRLLRRENQTLRQLVNEKSTVTLEVDQGGLPTAKSGWRERVELLELERDALTMALDTQRLKKVGLVEDSRGRILDVQGRALFPIGFATAVRKLTGAPPPAGASPVTSDVTGASP